MKTSRSVFGDSKVLQIFSGPAYIGKKIDPVQFYQIGYQWSNILPIMFFSFKTKPIIKNLSLINIAFPLLYLNWLIWLLIFGSIKGLTWFVFYCLVGFYPGAFEDFGWSKRYLILPILFWKITAISLATFIYLNF